MQMLFIIVDKYLNIATFQDIYYMAVQTSVTWFPLALWLRYIKYFFHSFFHFNY